MALRVEVLGNPWAELYVQPRAVLAALNATKTPCRGCLVKSLLRCWPLKRDDRLVILVGWVVGATQMRMLLPHWSGSECPDPGLRRGVSR